MRRLGWLFSPSPKRGGGTRTGYFFPSFPNSVWERGCQVNGRPGSPYGRFGMRTSFVISYSFMATSTSINRSW
jgi:hypothetical protein